MKKSLQERLESGLDKNGDCWVWTKFCLDSGYGRIRSGEKIELTHRVSWSIFKGPIPEGMWVLHKCDNPPCCNPDHLFLGDVRDNNTDRFKKNRYNTCSKGEQLPQSKLTEQEVRFIKFMKNKMSQRKLGEKFKVSPVTIAAIHTGKTWRHV